MRMTCASGLTKYFLPLSTGSMRKLEIKFLISFGYQAIHNNYDI